MKKKFPNAAGAAGNTTLNGQFQEAHRRKRGKKKNAAPVTGRYGGKIFRAYDSSRRDDVPKSWQITQLLDAMSFRVACCWDSAAVHLSIVCASKPRLLSKQVAVAWRPGYHLSKQILSTHLRADEVGVPSRLCRPDPAAADGIDASR